MPPTIPELASIGAAHAPQISAPLDAQLELDGFETAPIADLPTAVSLVLWRRLPVSLGAVLTELFGASCKGLFEVIVATISAWYS